MLKYLYWDSLWQEKWEEDEKNKTKSLAALQKSEPECSSRWLLCSLSLSPTSAALTVLKDGERDVRGHEDRHFWPHASCGGLGDRVLCVPSREHSYKASKPSCFLKRGSHFSGAGTEARDHGVFTSAVPSELPLDVNYGKYKGNEFRYLMEMGLCLLHHRFFLFFLEWVCFLKSCLGWNPRPPTCKASVRQCSCIPASSLVPYLSLDMRLQAWALTHLDSLKFHWQVQTCSSKATGS